LDVDLRIDLWPGDAPLPPREAGVSGALSPDERAWLERINSALAQRHPAVQACHVAAARDTPGLWGRLALRLNFDAHGRLLDADETESQFPSASLVRCVQEALHDVHIVPGSQGTTAGRTLGGDPARAARAPSAPDANADAADAAADRDPVGNDAPQGGSRRGAAPSAVIAAFRFGAPPPASTGDPEANGAEGAADGAPPP
jgi:hypothetical protein